MGEADRPRVLALVAGTGTEVGKTWVAAALARTLRKQALRVGARKPAQSYAEGAETTDAHELAAATGDAPTDVCPAHRWYPRPMAPFMAAAALGLPPFGITHLAQEVAWPDRLDVGLVESAGGVRSPIASDGGDTVALATILRPDLVVLVADAGLGTINSVRLSVDALADTEADLVVVLNRYDESDELHTLNREWLAANLKAPVLVGVDELAAVIVARSRRQDSS